MAKVNFNKMSIPELEELQAEVAQTIEMRRVQDREILRQQMSEMAGEAGFSLDELFGRGKGKKMALPPKYRNPDDASQTWSGRGRKPKWIEKAVKSGGKMDDFLIS